MHTSVLLVLFCLYGALAAQNEPRRRPRPEPFEPAPAQSQPQPVMGDPAPPRALDKLGLKTPESVVHDEVADVYLVSNINGAPTEADNNGFISRIKPDGTLENLTWIQGGKNGVLLDAPKGMAIVKDVLWVADIKWLRKFDRKSGKPLGSLQVTGATFLNDIAAQADGSLLVTDTGLKSDFSDSGTDAILKIAAGDQLDKKPQIETLPGKKPNGIAVTPNGARCFVSWGTGELFVDGEDGTQAIGKLPKGQLDGLLALSDDRWIVSSWEGGCVYEVERKKGEPKLSVQTLVKDLRAPADIGFDKKRNALLIPLFQDDKLLIWPLTGRR